MIKEENARNVTGRNSNAESGFYKLKLSLLIPLFHIADSRLEYETFLHCWLDMASGFRRFTAAGKLSTFPVG
ncbi:hypothetical protein scyTo_0020826 [Scyliorhinus torazame]|uniref:Uncharacterized protein n=1 Tax=Scyliorhinus torazame TaxID=75743 RepID=A0A401PNZ1_SCYTO|nr:hypothetical protein [Scyliorhinus torazame]